MKIFNLIAIMSGVVCFIACSKADSDPIRNAQINVTMSEMLTKTSIGTKNGSSYPLYWSAGDRISMNGNLSEALSADQAGKVSTTFTVKTGVSPFNVVYPGVSGVDNSITIEASQTLSSGAIKSGTLPMYSSATSLSSGLQMHPLGAIVRFALQGVSNITSITIAADGGENVGGTFTIGKTSEALNGKLTVASGSKTVAATSSKGVRLSESTPTYFYLVIAPGTYSKGLRATVVSDDSPLNAMTFSFGKSSNDFTAGQVFEVPVLTFDPTSAN